MISKNTLKIAVTICFLFIVTYDYVHSTPEFNFIGDFRLVRYTPSGAGRYPYGNSNSNFFDLATIGTSINFPIDNQSNLFFQFQFDSNINEGSNPSGGPDFFIDEAWYYKNELIGKLGGKFGIFRLPFSREHKGPFNSTSYTITPSMINSFYNDFRVTGLEIKKGYKVPGKHFDWRFGLASGVDTISFAERKMSYGDWWHKKVSPATEGSIGIYGYIGKNHSNSCSTGKLSWHGGFLINNGNDETLAPSGETNLLLMDFGYEMGKFAFLFQGLTGHTNYNTNSRESVEMNFSMIRWSFDKKLSISGRYDNWFTDDTNSDKTDQGHGYTGAISFKRSEKELIQLEYLRARPSTGDTIETAPLWQVRYLVSF